MEWIFRRNISHWDILKRAIENSVPACPCQWLPQRPFDARSRVQLGWICRQIDAWEPRYFAACAIRPQEFDHVEEPKFWPRSISTWCPANKHKNQSGFVISHRYHMRSPTRFSFSKDKYLCVMHKFLFSLCCRIALLLSTSQKQSEIPATCSTTTTTSASVTFSQLLRGQLGERLLRFFLALCHLKNNANVA